MQVQQMLGGRYKLLNELGSGGMAVVWRAHDEVLGRPVAVKLLAPQLADDPQSRARIRDEARAAAALSHPNIAQVYDYGESGETAYVVMELINGPTLLQRISGGPLPPRTVFRICGEVAAALAAAHAEDLVHRDIKMANIMVTPGGAKVVDFGIAAAAGLGVHEETVVGTPAYLAPERLTSDSVEPASDVYALGVLLYRLLSGESPWSVETTTQMLSAHVYIDPEPLPDLPGVPPAVTDLVGRCLHKHPADRPSATEVSAILGDAAEASKDFDPVRGELRETTAPRPRPANPAINPLPALVPAPDPIAGGQARAGGMPAGPASSRENGRDWDSDREPNAAQTQLAGSTPVPASGRKWLWAGGGVAAVVIAALVVFLVVQGQKAGSDRAAIGSVSVAPARSGAAVPAPSAAGPALTVPTSATTAPTTPTGPARSGGVGVRVPPVNPSIPGSAPPHSAGGTATPTPSVTPSTTAPPAAPVGTQISSPGGVVYASCSQGVATLSDWQPAEGYRVETVKPGPALTTAVVFTKFLSRFRTTVTCVAGLPTGVVLPL